MVILTIRAVVSTYLGGHHRLYSWDRVGEFAGRSPNQAGRSSRMQIAGQVSAITQCSALTNVLRASCLTGGSNHQDLEYRTFLPLSPTSSQPR